MSGPVRPQQFGALRRAANKAFDFLMGKKEVGRDAVGNIYFQWYEGSGEGRVEKREVQWATAYMYYDPNDIPPEWRMWLRKQREQPPTEEELARSAAQRHQMAARVAALDEKERLRRQRQEAMGTPDQHAGAQPDMARFIQQMGGKADGGAAAPGPEAPKRPSGPSEGYKPDSWKPGA
ncbi:hypothetical protein HYH03_003935 [Edaphochlamys debaryana]|uniref:NADH dehydrogenase [ubiquinone] 1 alpha subcomplex subunit 12 n=1 Tax=Edaphochlamys debaryana TaxID=47281 RepID=A0A835Y8E0_9CHLO|nr:hypothetical protein HYH03_003935 [Edaphochlamys debaryana]|eukprot:KAG2498180.1 hypothetical protein HYH03_003935 [Edaphochlamys debaryana]